ncbi:MAG: SH3 domain-containing protein [Burkholderiales bacterium]|nr:SH3 domain-containing protein [Burkholderiales bacterium]
MNHARTAGLVRRAWCLGLATLLNTSPAFPDPVRVALAAGPVHVLRDLTHLVRPSTAPANRVCAATAGDEAIILESAATESSPIYWVRVRFSSGACTSLEGWVASNFLQLK